MFFRTIALLMLVVFTATVAVTQKSLAHSSVFFQPNILIDQSLPQETVAKNLTESERLDELNSSEFANPTNGLPEVSPVQPIAIAQSENYAGRSLTDDDRTNIERLLRSKGIPLTSKHSPTGSPLVILHDTASSLEKKNFEKHKKEGRGPLGLGVSVWVTRQGATLLARLQDFYEPYRPTTTQFEKAADILRQDQRESLFRQVWQSTTENGHTQALKEALSNKDLEKNEIEMQYQSAITQLDSSSDKILTTATWTVESICKTLNDGDQSIAKVGKLSELKNACGGIKNYFEIRNQRVKNSVPIEIGQFGDTCKEGDDKCDRNSCNAKNRNLIKFDKKSPILILNMKT